MIAKIISSTQLSPDETALEVGPGQGALTQLIAPKVARLIAVEKDHRLIPALSKIENIELHESDILEFDIASIGSGIKIITNLPYNISSKALKHFASYKSHLSAIYIMLQKEFAEKMVNPMGSALSCYLNHHFNLSYLFEIPPACFTPRPRVRSAFISLIPNANPLEIEFFPFLELCFQERRKLLCKGLKKRYKEEKITEAYNSLGIDLNIRVEKLDEVSHFLEFCRSSKRGLIGLLGSRADIEQQETEEELEELMKEAEVELKEVRASAEARQELIRSEV